MILLLGSALAQWPTFEPPSTAPSYSPWGDQKYELGAGVVAGLGGDGTTITDTDFPGPGFLDGFADLQLSGAVRMNERTDLIGTAFLGTGSALGAGIGARIWLTRSELAGFALQLDAGLLYARAALPMVVHLDTISVYCAPTVQAALGAQFRTPVGVVVRPANQEDLSITMETGLAVSARDPWSLDWDEGLKYYGAVTVSRRFGPTHRATSPWS